MILSYLTSCCSFQFCLFPTRRAIILRVHEAALNISYLIIKPGIQSTLWSTGRRRMKTWRIISFRTGPFDGHHGGCTRQPSNMKSINLAVMKIYNINNDNWWSIAAAFGKIISEPNIPRNVQLKQHFSVRNKKNKNKDKNTLKVNITRWKASKNGSHWSKLELVSLKANNLNYKSTKVVHQWKLETIFTGIKYRDSE